MIDLHVHSEFSVDSDSKISQIATVAKLKGLKFVGITDHYEMREGVLKYGFDLERFVEAVDELESEVPVLKGVEWGWDCEGKFPDFEGFDYVMLSIHRCDASMEMPRSCYEDYFKRMLRCVKIAEFDVLAHMDFVRRYMPGNPPLPDDLRGLVIEILKVLKEKGAALELNTEGFVIYGEPQPPVWVLEEARKMEIPITIGSDAHNLENIGREVQRALKLLKGLGFEKVVVFKRRRIEEVEI